MKVPKIEIECPNLLAVEYTSNLLPFHSLTPFNPKHFRLEFHLVFENGFSTTRYPKVFIVLKDHKEVIILDLDGGLIEVMLSFFHRVEDLESTSRIIIASSSVNLKNEILTPMPPHLAFNMVLYILYQQLHTDLFGKIIKNNSLVVVLLRRTPPL